MPHFVPEPLSDNDIEEEVDDLLDQADSNEDGYVDFVEFSRANLSDQLWDICRLLAKLW